MSATSTLPASKPATVLGFDYGTKKIGVATGQAITNSATPIAPIKATDGVPNWAEIEKLLKEWQPNALIVGLPTHMDGTATDITKRAQKFANRLNGRFNLPTYVCDERLTTYDAQTQWADLAEIYGWPKHFIDNHWIDSLAAALIIQTWFQEFESD